MRQGLGNNDMCGYVSAGADRAIRPEFEVGFAVVACLPSEVTAAKPPSGSAATVGAPSKLGASFGVKCPRGNCVSDRVRANHPPIPSVATARKVVQEV
jgi:hypothetical protein